MTKDEIFKLYISREKAANATPQGADHKSILESVATEAGLPVSEVRSIVLDGTVMGPN